MSLPWIGGISFDPPTGAEEPGSLFYRSLNVVQQAYMNVLRSLQLPTAEVRTYQARPNQIAQSELLRTVDEQLDFVRQVDADIMGLPGPVSEAVAGITLTSEISNVYSTLQRMRDILARPIPATNLTFPEMSMMRGAGANPDYSRRGPPTA